MPHPLSTPESRQRRSGTETGSPSVARRGRRLWPVLSVAVGFALFGVVVLLAYQDTSRGPSIGEPPLIKAAADPIKLPPEEAEESEIAEGGAVGRLWSDAERADQPERLLPPPEEPLSLEVVAAPQPEVATAGSGEPPASAPPVANEGGLAALPGPTPAPQPPEGETVTEAEAALDRLLAEVAALGEEEPVAAAAPTGPETPAGPPSPSPPPATVAVATPAPPLERPALAEPSPRARVEAPATEALGARSAETTEIRRASALTPAEPGSEPGRPRGTASDAGGAAAPPPQATQVAAIDDRYRIQLAAVRDEVDARRAWDELVTGLGPVLNGVRPYFERAETADGTFYRLQVGPFATAEPAESLCEELKRHNASCFVIRR